MAETKIYAGKEGIQELWRRIKSEIGKLTAFQKADAAPDGTPDIDLSDRKTNIIYLVPVDDSPSPDHYMEWIWTTPASAEPEWVCIGDTTTEVPTYETVNGTVEDTTLTVGLTHNRYTKFNVASTITDIVVNVPADGPDKVGWFKFEFTLPEDTDLESVHVLDASGNDCLIFSPMRWRGQVTYKGEVIDELAKIIGYPEELVDPLNPLGLPDYTIRLKFDTTEEPSFEHGEATLVESSRGSWSVWDLTYESSDWTQLLARQSHLVEILGANATNVTNMLAFVNGCSNLEKIALFDTSMVENMCYAFGYCPKLETLPEFNLSSITNMSYAFCGCHALKSFTARTPNLRGTKIMFQGCRSLESVDIDTENVTDFEQMFQGCTALVHGPDINLSSAQNLKYMFEDCTALEDVPNYNTSKGVNFYGMFYNCSSLNDVPDLNTNSAECMQLMFNNCSSLVTAPAFNTSTVTDMKYMFSGCRALVNVTHYDTTSLEECQGMFSLTAITEVPDMDLSKIKNLSTMFGDCKSLVTIPDMNLTKAVDVSWMFAGCNNVEHGAFDLYAKLINRTSITSYSNCFKDCGKNTETGLEELEMIMTSWGGLQDLPLHTIRCKYAAGTTPTLANGSYTLVSAEDNIYDITNDASYWYYTVEGDTNLLEVIKGNLVKTNGLYRTFRNCSNLTKVGKICTSTNLDSCYYAFGSCTSLVSVELFETANVTTMYSMFYLCNNLESVPQFNTSKVSDFRWMFYNCSKLTELPLLDTHRATSFYNTFAYCINLTSLPLFDTSSVTEMTEAFEGCSKITTIPQFDFSNVTTMRYTFRYCDALTSIPLLNTSNVTDMYYAFYYCNNLTNVPLLDTSNVSDMRYMLAYCESLNELPLFSTESATNMYRAFYNCFNVQRGALALYQQASTQTNPPTDHVDCFANCGRDTVSGLAELEEIPTDWGGVSVPSITMKFTDGITPTFSAGTAVQLSTSPNVWKLKTPDLTSWDNLLQNQTELLEVTNVNTLDKITRMQYLFYGCTKLTTVCDMKTENVQKVDSMFMNCTSLTSVAPFSTSRVTSLEQLFCNCSSLTTLPNISYDRIIRAGKMCQNCTNLASVNISCPKLQDSYDMFNYCESLVSANIEVTSSLSTASNMFGHCTNLSSVTITFTDRCLLSDASYMFQYCTSMKTLPQLPVSYNVVNMNKMFYNCYNAENNIYELYEEAISRTPSRAKEKYTDCFKNCGRDTVSGQEALAKISTSWGGLLNYNPLGLPAKTIRLKFKDNVSPTFSKGTATQVSASPNVWDLTYDNSYWTELLNNQTDLQEVLGANSEGVESMYYMFYGCSNLTAVAMFDTTLVRSMGSIFYNCTKLTTVPLFYTKNLTSTNYMFTGCYQLTTVPLFDTSNVTNMSGMFWSCMNLRSIPKFDMSKVTNTQYMFSGCEKLESIPELNTSNVKYMDRMFSGCRVLTEVTTLDTSSAITLDGLFNMCYQLTTLPESLNTSKVTSITNMFYECKSLTSIPQMDTSHVTSFNYAFKYCESLTTMPSLDTSAASYFDCVFIGCKKINSGIYSMYQQVSNNSSITSHSTPFSCCGIDTDTGYAELQQIPLEWGGIPTLNLATIGDRQYHVVQIGSQLWMAENLDWKKSGITIGDSASSYTVSKANYYDDDETKYGVNGNKSGLLYNFTAGQSIGSVDGWHVPSKSEWQTLINNIGGTSKINDLLLAGDWGVPNLVDKYGFRIRPTGYSYDGGSSKIFDSMDSSCYYLTSTAYATQQCQVVLAYYNNIQFVTPGKDSQYAIRLVKSV